MQSLERSNSGLRRPSISAWMSCHAELVADAVAAHHVLAPPHHVLRLAAGIAFEQRGESHLAMARRDAQARHAFFQHEAADRPYLRAGADFLGLDHEHVGNRAAGDPHRGARELVAAIDLVREPGHGAGIRAMGRPGSPKSPISRNMLASVCSLRKACSRRGCSWSGPLASAAWRTMRSSSLSCCSSRERSCH